MIVRLKRLHGVACAFLLAACATASTPDRKPHATQMLADASWRQRCDDASVVDVSHHDVQLSLQLSPLPSLTGHGFIRVRAAGATSVLVLDAQTLKVTSVSMDNTDLPFQQQNDRLCIALPQALSAGADATVALNWQVATDGKTPLFFPEQVWAGYSASAWMPTRQDPAQRATLLLRIVTPSALNVAASGRLLTRKLMSDGTTEHTFTTDRPSPPFLFAFAAGTFVEAERQLDDVTLRALGPSAADLEIVLTLTEAIYRLFRERTGVSPPQRNYTQVFVHGDAAQEAAGLSLIADSYLDDLRKDPHDDWVFSHEFAHQWFAWLLPCADFADFWLNEGLATFFVGVFKEHRLGRAAYEQELANWRASSARAHANGQDAPVSLSNPELAPQSPILESQLQARGITYARGALVLDKLRRELGEAVFWKGVQQYVGDAAGTRVRTEDLRRALEVASGRDLAAFFAKWIYSPAPDL